MTTIFISKMEGLPPTSATKMIDYWLILCQLVPFAQVVLLTAKEYLREDGEKSVENDDIQQPTQTKDNLHIKLEESTVSKEAWTISKITPSRAGSLTMLAYIGIALID